MSLRPSYDNLLLAKCNSYKELLDCLRREQIEGAASLSMLLLLMNREHSLLLSYRDSQINCIPLDPNLLLLRFSIFKL